MMMKLNFYICGVGLLFLLLSSVYAKKINNCRAELDSGLGIVDLSSLDDPTYPKAAMSSLTTNNEFYYNPCSPIQCAANPDTAVCMKQRGQPTAGTDIGKQQSVQFDETGSVLVLVYKNIANRIDSRVQCVCSNTTTTSFTHNGVNPANTYLFTLSSVCCCPNGCKAVESGLNKGENVSTGVALVSPSRMYSLILQADGNLVLVKNKTETLWHSNTAMNGAVTLSMQENGNLVLTRANGRQVWSSHTSGLGVRAECTDQGSVDILDAENNTVWSTRFRVDTLNAGFSLALGQQLQSFSTSTSSRYSCVFESTGNLAVFDRADKVWTSKTERKGAVSLIMQVGGNLEMRDSRHKVVWTTNTQSSGRGGNRLECNNNGTLLILDSHNDITWSSAGSY